MLKKQKSEKIFTVILTILLFVFLGLVFYVNLSCNPEYYDGDIYADIKYAKEAWNAKSLFPSNWIFGNQTYVVATPVLAALLFGIIGNGITAMAIASCIMTVLIVLSYNWMTRTIFSYNERMSGFLFFVAVGLFCGHVATTRIIWQLFFTMASYYACYLITAFIVFGCYIRIKQKNFKKLHLLFAAVGVTLSFATGMQSLRQTAVMTLPLIACEALLIIIDLVKKKRLVFSKSTAFTATISIANLAGIVVMKYIKINQHMGIKTNGFISSADELIRNTKNSIGYAIHSLGISGANLYTNIAASAVFFIIIFLGIFFCTKKYIKNGFKSCGSFMLMFLFFLACAAVFASGCLINIDGHPSYYFMIYPLLAICVAYLVHQSKSKNFIILTVISVFVAVMLCTNTVKTIREVQNDKNAENSAYQISEYMLDNGYENLYAVFGLNQTIKGSENIVVASNDKIRIIQFKRLDCDTPLKPVEYLRTEDEYLADNQKSIYIFRGNDYDEAQRLAEKYEVEMTLLKTFDGKIYLCKMSENICAKTILE